MNNNKGITLIALVITIIVLLILAGIAISMLSGENGILRQAAEAKEETEIANNKEMANLMLQEIYIIKNSGEVSKEKLEESKFTVYTIDNKYVVLKDDIGFVLDSKGNVLAQSSDEIVYDIYLVKKDYLAYKEANPEDKTTTLSNPYNNISKYENNNTELVKVIGESYKSDKYTLSLQNGNLVCLYNPDTMTEEKIKVCEALGIYYHGDGNGDHIIDWWDYQMIIDKVNKIITIDERMNIVLDMNSKDGVNANDTVSFKTFLSDYITKELLVIPNFSYEYLTTLNEQGILNNEEYKQINATTDEEIKKYISSYREDLDLPYKMVIQRGGLYWVYDKTKIYAPSYISATNINILGDIDANNKINETDITGLETLIKNSTYIENGDLNNNGTLDEEDLQLLKELVN